MDLPAHHSLKWFVFFGGLLASWLSFSQIVPFYIFCLLWLSAFVFLAVHKSYLRYLIILFSIWVFLPIITFVETTRDYFRGDAVFYRSVLTDEQQNLDPKFRVWNERKSGLLLGEDILVREAANLSVRFWVTIHGYQKKAYAGIYPDAVRANQIISTAKIFPFEKTTTTIRIKFDNGVYEMSDVKYIGTEDLSKCFRARVAIINNEVVIVKPVTSLKPSIIYLADYKTNSIIARYFDAEGQGTDSKITGKRKGKKRSNS